MSEIVLGVGAGIAAYKVCELLRRFTESGHDVQVVPTRDALRFVGEPTWAALSGRPVRTEVWSEVDRVPHVRIGQHADLVFVAPATADLLARAAHGLADDLLTNTLLTARCPVVFAPAMHTEMWEHPATRANVATLRTRGAIVVDPASGRLTGADSGPGRLPDPAELYEVARRVLARKAAGAAPSAVPDLADRLVVVSAGGTREALDPVRFLGNRSSGLQGYALARTAVARGARVTLVAANVALPDPAGARVVRVGSAREMRDAVVEESASADAVVMAAAVADFRPADYRDSKIKKTPGGEPEPIHLIKNPDILAELVTLRAAAGAGAANPAATATATATADSGDAADAGPAPVGARTGQVIVGFAAETDDVLDNGRDKLARKGCDLLVVNQVGESLTFGAPDNAAVILAADPAGGRPEGPAGAVTLTEVPRGPKEDLADAIWDLVAERLRCPAG